MKMKLFLYFGLAFFLNAGGVSGSLSCAQEVNAFILPQYSQKVSLDFRNAELRDVLKVFAQQIGANFLTTKDVPSDQSVTVYLEKVPVEDALEKILTANGLAYEYDALSNVFVIKPLKDPDTILVTRVYQLKYAQISTSKVSAAISQIDITQDVSTTVATGSAGSEATILNAVKSVLKDPKAKCVEEQRTNSLIITDAPSNFSVIERLLARLDVPPCQVMIEVEMLDVKKDLTDYLGFTPQTGGAGAILAISKPSIMDLNPQKPGFERYGKIFQLWKEGNLTTSIGTIIQFLRDQTDTITLARPRIMTLDNETAQVKVSTNESIGIKSVTETAVEGSTPTKTVEAEREETGIILTVTPQVSVLTDEITLVVEPKVVEAVLGMLAEGVQFKDPETRGSKSILRVKNGETIVMAGLLRKKKNKSLTKIPVLGDIPLLGGLFRGKTEESDDRELLIIMTPRIIEPYGIGSAAEGGGSSGDENREQTTADGRAKLIKEQMERAFNSK